MNNYIGNYLIELSAIHLTLMLGYWLILRKERQYTTMRSYLLASVAFALIVPLLKLPRLFNIDEQVYIIATRPSAGHAVTLSPPDHAQFWSYDLLIWPYILVSTFLLLKFLNSIRQLLKLKNTNRYERKGQFRIHRVPGMQG